MEELGLDKGVGSVCYGQLLGMCDHVSLTLGELQDSLLHLNETIKLFIYQHISNCTLNMFLTPQLKRVMPYTSQYHTDQLMTHYHIWCAALRKTVQCCRESVKRGTS